MQVSEARLAANRANSLKSRGPVSDLGKSVSRGNSTRHSLSGSGKVVPEGDVEEIQARVEAFTLDMKPKTAAGAILITKMATLSVRMERAADHEAASIALKVRHAADTFDDERFDRANTLFDGLAADPRATLRKLKRMPEGVEKLVEAWEDLKADLTIDPDPAWTDEQLERAANLTGLKSRHARGSRFGSLNRAIRGDFAALSAADGAGLGEAARKAWAKAELLESIEAEIAALEAHHETLDFETLAIDRAEAGDRALFDDSKPASLARRYESEARRGFFKALKEFRLVEAEAEARSEATSTAPSSSQAGSKVGSFRQMTPPPAREPGRTSPEAPSSENLFSQGGDGQPLVYVPPVKTPG